MAPVFRRKPAFCQGTELLGEYQARGHRPADMRLDETDLLSSSCYVCRVCGGPFRSRANVKVLVTLLAQVALLAATPALAQLQCNQGPLTRNFGGAPWLVYACSDGQSLVFITPPASKAHPFVFNLKRAEGGQYWLSGEGTGSKTVTDAAAKELGALSADDIGRLLHDVRGSKN